MYVVNYDDGYAIVSATKNYHPVLAVVDHGTYTGEKTGTGQDVLMNEYMVATEAAMDGEISVDKSVWSEYEEVPFEIPAQTKVSDEYNDVVNQYTGEWYQAGYNIYRLNQKPENMPDDMYAEFCDYARDYDRPDHDYMQCSFIVENTDDFRYQSGPYINTAWGQENAYNDGLDANLPLGCTTVAIAQIMKSIGHPSTIDWYAMPNVLGYYETNTTLTNFLAQLRGHIGVDDNGGATITEVKTAICSQYGYRPEFDFNTSIVSHNSSSVRVSLANGYSVFMGGQDSRGGDGHAWACDGYYSLTPQTEYYLYVIPMRSEITYLEMIDSRIVYPELVQVYNYYHMNMGWYGIDNGWYYEDNVSTSQGNYKNDRSDLIITRTQS